MAKDKKLVEAITAMEDAGLGIELVEQPVSYHDFKGMQYVTAQVETPILADESVFSYEDAVRLMEEKGADLINIKLMKTGGKYRIFIPPALGYGDKGAAGVIPPGVVLDFTVSLLDIVPQNK